MLSLVLDRLVGSLWKSILSFFLEYTGLIVQA